LPCPMSMNRRQFVNRGLTAAGGLLLARGVDATGTAPRFAPSDLVSLGSEGMTVSRMCLGTGMRGGNRQSNHTRMGYERFEALVQGAYERGVRFFDLADLYGTHQFFARAMQGVPRDSYSIATKIWFRSGGIPETERPDAGVIVQRFLEELQTETIDLLLLHCAVSPDWTTEERRHMDGLEDAKQKGLIRAHGVSCHSLAALEACIDEPWVDSVHARINPYGQNMDGPPEVVVPVLRKIHAAGKGVVGMKLIGEGTFRDSDEKRNRTLEFVLGMDFVDVLLVGCETLDEVDDFTARMLQFNAAPGARG
jgi:predicted aldo/keto reductase-like oxidoreductase